MKWTSLNDLRESYLSFFESKGHLRHKSYPLIPADDKSLLLINAGMAPLKKYFTGEQEPPRHRMTTCQKCIRTPDIERVGKTARHGTFFEMLGNFSFGDYFKKEAISWAWEYLTTVLEIPADKLWVTIYENDDEAFEYWTQINNVPAERILRCGKADNFWEIGSGPCGPDSEIHYDRGEGIGCGRPDCGPTCDCDRFLEIWNLVFTQFDGDGKGNYTPLAHPNIDTGMGLERLAVVMQGVNNLFEVDTVQNIMKAISDKAGIKYGENEKSDVSLRVITDHIRSTCFLVCDGVVPSNEGRGYVLRRLLRRAARHGRLLGIKGTFLSDIVNVVAHENLTAYPELTEKLDYIKKIVSIEEEKFAKTIDGGSEILNSIIEKTIAEGGNVLSGEDIFKLNDTFGFPIDLTREIAEEKGLQLDEEGFHALMNEQKQRARAARVKAGDFGWAAETLEGLDGITKTQFVGYTENKTEAKVLTLIDPDANEVTGSRDEGGKVIIVLNQTSFYAESGGQIGDTGYIESDNCKIRIDDTKKTHDGIYLHFGTVEQGSIYAGDSVMAVINVERRNAIRRNHSAAHLLQAALREVLGVHVEQAGSYVDDKRVRFDFSHYTAMTAEEIERVEHIVCEKILAAMPVTTIETDVETAKKNGAMALFGEKYGSVVRMVKMGDFSTELCGGTHLNNTAEAGLFKIISESSVAAGVRRIEGTTGLGVLELLNEKDLLIASAARELKANNTSDIDKRAAALQAELKAEKLEIERLNDKLAAAAINEIMNGAKTVGKFKLTAGSTVGLSVAAVRAVCDKIRNDPDSVVVISTEYEGKYNFVACIGANAVKNGAHAGNILKALSAIVGGGGGGRPDSATSGIKDGAKIPEALCKVTELLNNL